MRVWGLASLSSAELASSLVAQMGVNATGLRQNFFFYGKPQFPLLRSPTNWLRPDTYVMEGKLFYFKYFTLY